MPRSFTAFLSPPRWLLLPMLLGALLLAGTGASGQFWFTSKPMPQFKNQSPQAWINSDPLQPERLKGKVVLIEIWTSI